MFVETKKIIWSHDVTFCKNSIIEKHLKDGPSGRIEQSGVIMDESSKSPMTDFHDEDKDGGEEDDDDDALSI